MYEKMKNSILVLVLSFIIITDIANAYAAEKPTRTKQKHAISIPGEVVVTPEMFESGSDFYY